MENENDEGDEEDAGEDAAERDCFRKGKGRGEVEWGLRGAKREPKSGAFPQLVNLWSANRARPSRELTGRDVYGWVHVCNRSLRRLSLVLVGPMRWVYGKDVR